MINSLRDISYDMDIVIKKHKFTEVKNEFYLMHIFVCSRHNRDIYKHVTPNYATVCREKIVFPLRRHTVVNLIITLLTNITDILALISSKSLSDPYI